MDRKKRPVGYHMIILSSAAIVLILGAFLRTRFHEDAVENEIPVLDALQSEVQAIKRALGRNELESISGLIDGIARDVGSAVVSVTPAAEAPRISIKTYDDRDWNQKPAPASPVNAEAVSGLLLDREGHVLTTARIRQFRQPVQILLDGSEKRTADLLAIDEIRQTALLRIRESLPVKSIPEFAQEQPGTGSWLLRLGRSPFGRLNLSLGLLSGVREDGADGTGFEMESNGSAAQDGSPVFDFSGRIVGISRFEPAGQTLSVLPISSALEVLKPPKSGFPLAPQSWIGLEVQDLDKRLKRYFGIDRGVLVTDSDPAGPAFSAGLRPLDVVVRMNEVTLDSAQQLIQAIQLSPPGKKLSLQIVRSGRKIRIECEKTSPAVEPGIPEGKSPRIRGLELFVAPPQKTPEGIEVKEVLGGSAAEKLGLRAGDRVMAVNGLRLRKPADLQSRRIQTGRSGLHLWQIKRGDRDFCIAVENEDEMP